MVADMATQIDAARLLVRRAAFNHDVGLPFTMEAAMAKLYASEAAMDVTTKCVQIYGGYGYIREYPMERMMRDAKITEIYEGTSRGSENGHLRSATALSNKGGKLNYESNCLCKAGSGYLRQGSCQSRRHPEPCIYGNHHQPRRPERSLRPLCKLKDANRLQGRCRYHGSSPRQRACCVSCIAMGADEGVLVSGREFGGSDTFATSQILAAAIKKHRR